MKNYSEKDQSEQIAQKGSFGFGTSQSADFAKIYQK